MGLFLISAALHGIVYQLFGQKKNIVNAYSGKASIIKKYWSFFKNSQVLKFIFVGALNTTVGYTLFALFILLHMHYTIAVAFSMVGGVINSFLWNKYFTFKNSRRINYREVIKFITVYGVVYVLNIGILFMLVDTLNYNPLVAQIFALIAIACTSFLGQKHWAFKTGDTVTSSN